MAWRLLGAWLAVGVVAGGCEPADDVDVLSLPPLERPSPEARLGLPELAGTWRFAGWEVLRGDSLSLERTFPSFGELRIETQRLDSIAGTFMLGGAPARVVGDVRRDGHVSLVTMAGDAPVSFIAGRFASDTLWLELTSILPQDEWPRDARAAFVQEPVTETVAWLRGTRPGQQPDSLLVDSVAASAAVPPGGLGVEGGVGAGIPPAGGVGQPAVSPRTTPSPGAGTPSPARQPAEQPRTSPAPQPITPAQPREPVQPAPPQPTIPESPPEPEEAPEPEPDEGPRLLGVPVER